MEKAGHRPLQRQLYTSRLQVVVGTRGETSSGGEFERRTMPAAFGLGGDRPLRTLHRAFQLETRNLPSGGLDRVRLI
jgi:hypothetical protein